MVLLEFSMSPLDKGIHLSPYVARIIDVIDKSGLPYRLNPMGTVIEGEYDAVMQVVKDCFKTLEEDCERISVSLKIDYRKGSASRMDQKIERIESHLGRQIKK